MIRHISNSSIIQKSQNSIYRAASCFLIKILKRNRGEVIICLRQCIWVSSKLSRSCSQRFLKQRKQERKGGKDQRTNPNTHQNPPNQCTNEKPELFCNKSQPSVKCDVSPSTYSHCYWLENININTRWFLSKLPRMFLHPCTNRNRRFAVMPIHSSGCSQ